MQPTYGTPARDRSGFTLIEVLLAVVILTTGISIVFRGFTTGLRAASLAQKETTAVMLAQMKVADVEIEAEEGLVLGSEEGDFEEEYEDRFPGYRWLIEIDEPEDELIIGLYEVRVTIFWPDMDSERQLTITRFVVQESEEIDLAQI